MNKIWKKFLTFTLAATSAFGLFACSDKDTGDKDPEYYVPKKENVADVIAPDIFPSYEYKIALVGEETALPTVEFSENNVTASYTLDGVAVQAGSAFTPTEETSYVFEIKAQDKAGNKTTPKKVVIRATSDENELNKVYDLTNENGLETHLGTARGGVNMLNVRLIQEGVEVPKDMYGNEIPAVTDKQTGEIISEEFVYLSNYTKWCRITFNNPLHTRWDEKFDQIYFYFYHGGEQNITLNFNNYTQVIGAKTGWTKVIVAPKTVTVDGDDPTTAAVETSYQKVVTDYSYISSLGGSASLEGLFDLVDCQGAFLLFTLGIEFEQMAISSFYGLPKA